MSGPVAADGVDVAPDGGTPIADHEVAWPVSEHRVLGRGRVCNFVEDELCAPGGGERFRRQYETHPGAVGVVALDDRDRVAVVRQYRHPIGMELVELPAGLLDVPGEPGIEAARRELAEEAQLAADHWAVLVDSVPSPGGSEESVRIFLATGLHPADRPEGFVLEDEEAQMTSEFVPLADLTDAVFEGRVQNGHLVAGIMALQVARATGRTLRPADAPWPVRAVHDGQDRVRP